MSRYLVDVCHYSHTCPADDVPHVVDTRRAVVEHTPGGPCEEPVTVRCGDRAAVVDCRRARPADRQCPACRTVIEVRHETTVHIGPYVVPSSGMSGGEAEWPCRICAEPLAAALDSWGVHILCHRYGRP